MSTSVAVAAAGGTFDESGQIWGLRILNADAGAMLQFDEGPPEPVTAFCDRYPDQQHSGAFWRRIRGVAGASGELRVQLARASDDRLGGSPSPLTATDSNRNQRVVLYGSNGAALTVGSANNLQVHQTDLVALIQGGSLTNGSANSGSVNAISANQIVQVEIFGVAFTGGASPQFVISVNVLDSALLGNVMALIGPVSMSAGQNALFQFRAGGGSNSPLVQHSAIKPAALNVSWVVTGAPTTASGTYRIVGY